MDIYHSDFKARYKADASPVSDADELGEAIILASLKQHVPDIPVLAEEAASRGEHPATGNTFILVDPLDGTKEFINRNGEFTVNIALIENGKPVVGAVYAPVLGKLWFSGAVAYVCDVGPGQPLPAPDQWHRLGCRSEQSTGMVALASRSHTDEATENFLKALPICERRSAGSSLKFCALAEGNADVYPRFGPTMEWDTAAGDAVLRAAGGCVIDATTHEQLAYGKQQQNYRNDAFVAWADPKAVRF